MLYSGPCNSFNCLGNFKMFLIDHDDDDNDDALFIWYLLSYTIIALNLTTCSIT